MEAALIEHLAQFVTPHKRELLEKVLSERTRRITVVLEDLYQGHNASAIMRSCDCFGIQDIHAIEAHNALRANPDIALGSSQWLSIHQYNQTTEALAQLKESGYLIVAATLHPESIPLQALDGTQKMALCFGTEEKGLSQAAHNAADLFVKIPMVGFTQSFNVSVSASLILYELTNQLRRSTIDWHLTEPEKTALKIKWLTQIVPHGETIKSEFIKQYEKK